MPLRSKENICTLMYVYVLYYSSNNTILVVVGECKEFYDDFWIYGSDNETTTDAPDEDDTGSGSGSGEGEEELSKEELQALFGPQRCKPEPVEPCQNSTFGCCPDGFHSANGPFDAGCDPITTCQDTKYGCCKDGVSPAQGMGFEGCQPANCQESLWVHREWLCYRRKLLHNTVQIILFGPLQKILRL